MIFLDCALMCVVLYYLPCLMICAHLASSSIASQLFFCQTHVCNMFIKLYTGWFVKKNKNKNHVLRIGSIRDLSPKMTH